MDKSKQVIVVSMAEKRRLEANGFTNVVTLKDKEVKKEEKEKEGK